MANINATASARFEAGGIFSITPQGGTILVVLNIAPGTIGVKPVMITPIPWEDRMVQQVPLEGKVEPGEIRVTLRCSKYATAELWTVLTARKAAPDGYVPVHAIEVKVPAHKTGTTGEKFNTTTAYLKEAPTLKGGADFDTVEMVFGLNDLVAATY